jgi:hypothetical protein
MKLFTMIFVMTSLSSSFYDDFRALHAVATFSVAIFRLFDAS